MPRAQYVNQAAGIRKTADFPFPKRVDDVRAWIKSARKKVPEIPDIALLQWKIMSTQITLDTILVEFQSQKGERSYLLIERRGGIMDRQSNRSGN